MVGLPSEFRANLESYNGPLDLLLYLIKKDEIDVFDIPIAEVVVQYQIYLSLIKDLNPNLCGDFLVMAARLMEIAEPDTIFVGPETARRISNHFSLVDVGDQTLKNVTEPVTVYQVVDAVVA